MKKKSAARDYRHPLAEVFGFPVDNFSEEAKRFRANRLCPYNNKVPSCTKDKANDPLGVCSIFEDSDSTTIVCPIRFRQNWQIAVDAASYFFPKGTRWTSLTEVRLNDKNGMSAGNIDVVLVSYDDRGKILDFGALEIQAVYISGNIRRLFQAYIDNPSKKYNLDWSKEKNYPRPDYLSSSRKRLVPQLIYKGEILRTWKKKIAVALHEGFYNTLPTLTGTASDKSDIAWMTYDLAFDKESNLFKLAKKKAVFTAFDTAIKKITLAEAGPIDNFISVLQEKLDEKLGGVPPSAPTLTDIIEIEP